MARFRSLRGGHHIRPEAARGNGAGPIGDTRNQDIKQKLAMLTTRRTALFLSDMSLEG